MELRNALVAVLLYNFFCSVESFTVNAIEPNLFPLNENATISCVFDPVPENLNNIRVGWYITANGDSTKVGSSSIASSSLYSTAPASIHNRFSMSSDKFGDGIADATIAHIMVGDETIYACDVDILASSPQQQREEFSVNVYNEPTVYVEDRNTELTLLPVPTPTEAIPGIENVTTPATTLSPEDDEVEIAACIVSFAYPTPTKIVFKDVSTGSTLKEVESSDYVDVMENYDGTFNVTARLLLDPTPALDKATIICSTFITDTNKKTDSENESSVISVKYSTSLAGITIEPSVAVEGTDVTITCSANGNPEPKKTLYILDTDTSQPVDDSFTLNVDRDSPKNFKCIASNNDMSDPVESNSAQLTVQYMEDPRIEAPNSVAEGYALTLKCRAVSNAAVSYEWSKDGKVLGAGETHYVYSAKDADAGTYICKATGVHTRTVEHNVNVEVGCEPKVDKTVSGSTKKAGNAHVEITCTARGNPGCQMSLLPAGYGPYKPVAELNKITLTIDDMVTQATELQFNCTASNEISKATETVKIGEEPACCLKEPEASGASAGVVVLIVILVIGVIVGLGVLWYCLKKKRSSEPRTDKEKPLDDPETANLKATPDENDA